MNLKDVFDETPKYKLHELIQLEGNCLPEEQKKSLREILTTCKEKYSSITITYMGSGDSFESFSCGEGLLRSGKSETTNEISDKYDEFLFYLLDNSDADFNNDGSSGEIIFNLDLGTVVVANTYYVTEGYPSDIETFY